MNHIAKFDKKQVYNPWFQACFYGGFETKISCFFQDYRFNGLCIDNNSTIEENHLTRYPIYLL